MSDILALIAERKIREAMERGEFDNLPGKGRPIPHDDEILGVPEELRMGYKILKNAGFLPLELELRREILTLGDLIRACVDEEEKTELRRRLSMASLHYDVLAEKNRSNPAFRQYRHQITDRIGY
jgi:hypothetical protein